MMTIHHPTVEIKWSCAVLHVMLSLTVMRQKLDNPNLSYKDIYKFWVPLAATWLMMAVEGPFLAAIIARLPEAKFNLAAYGVAWSLALIMEAPIIMLMSASTALVKNKDAYLKLRRFTNVLNAGITVVMLFLVIPPVFYFLTEDLIGLPHNVARLTHTAMLLLLPWPAAIGFRRFYQGILIRSRLTRLVAYGTIIRLFSMGATAVTLFLLKVNGAASGAAALSMGVTCEAFTGWLMARKSVKKLLAEGENAPTASPPLTYSYITKFYIPLAMTSILSLGVHPFITFFLGKSRFAIESLAVLPVINSLVFLFRSMGLSYQEVVIALMGEKGRDYIPLRNFAIVMGMLTVTGLGLITFTPLASVWFQQISGLSVELAQFAFLPAQLMTLLPALTVLISFQRSLLVSSAFTSPITTATAIEVTGIIGVLWISIFFFDAIGAVAAALAYTIGRLMANAYLLPKQLEAVKRIREPQG